VFGFIVPRTDERGVEKELFALRAPILPVEYTLVGSVELVVTNGTEEAQNECPVAAVVPLVPFRIASVEVITVAGSLAMFPVTIVGPVVKFKIAPGYHVPPTSVHAA
jgi:hypothetical protein